MNESTNISESLSNNSQKSKVLDYLLKNPTKVHFDQIKKELNLSESSIRTSIRLIRKSTPYTLILKKKQISIRINHKIPTKKMIIDNMTINEQPKRSRNICGINKMIEILNSNPDGISTNKIIDIMHFNKCQIYSTIHMLKKKGYKIIQNNGKYKLLNYSNNKNNSISANEITINQSYQSNKNYDNSIIPSDYKEMFNNLPDNDKIDCIDMLKKSLYYKRSAIALIESNQQAIIFCKSLSNGGN